MAVDFSNSSAIIRRAYKYHDFDTIIQLINNKDDANGYYDFYDDGSAYYNLYLAAMCGNIGLVKHLVLKGAMINQVSGHLEWTALHIAAYLGSFDIVKFLLENGADSEIRDKYGSGNGRTAVDLAKDCISMFEPKYWEIIRYIESYVSDCFVKGVQCE